MKGRMTLWDAVCSTDPKITEHVGQRGGFTAIDAQSQLKEATKQWGPFGFLWGFKDEEYKWLTGNGDGKITDVVFAATFYYPAEITPSEDGDAVAVGSFREQTDQAYRTGNDTSKKLRTDLLTKCLSRLGYNSDVFEGKFDDNGYVEDQKKKYGGGDEKPLADKPAHGASELKQVGAHIGDVAHDLWHDKWLDELLTFCEGQLVGKMNLAQRKALLQSLIEKKTGK